MPKLEALLQEVNNLLNSAKTDPKAKNNNLHINDLGIAERAFSDFIALNKMLLTKIIIEDEKLKGQITKQATNKEQATNTKQDTNKLLYTDQELDEFYGEQDTNKLLYTEQELGELRERMKQLSSTIIKLSLPAKIIDAIARVFSALARVLSTSVDNKSKLNFGIHSFTRKFFIDNWQRKTLDCFDAISEVEANLSSENNENEQSTAGNYSRKYTVPVYCPGTYVP